MSNWRKFQSKKFESRLETDPFHPLDDLITHIMTAPSNFRTTLFKFAWMHSPSRMHHLRWQTHKKADSEGEEREKNCWKKATVSDGGKCALKRNWIWMVYSPAGAERKQGLKGGRGRGRFPRSMDQHGWLVKDWIWKENHEEWMVDPN